MTLAEVEREVILATLRHCGGNKRRTAEMLGVSVKTVYNKLVGDCDAWPAAPYDATHSAGTHRRRAPRGRPFSEAANPDAREVAALDRLSRCGIDFKEHFAWTPTTKYHPRAPRTRSSGATRRSRTPISAFRGCRTPRMRSRP